MKIGIYSSPSHTVPHNEKRILAPWTLTAQLVEGLVDRLHDVTLFASVGSKTRAHLESAGVSATETKRSSYSDPKDYDAYVQAQSLLLFRHMISVVQKNGIDVVHVQKAIELLYPTLLDFPGHIPIVCTFHDPITPERYSALSTIAALPNIHFVSISHSQQRGAPFSFTGVIPNGVDTHLFRPDPDRYIGGNMLIAGRIVPEKGFMDAIAAVRQSGERLMMVGEPSASSGNQTYFETSIRPSVDGKKIFWEPVMKPEHLVGHYQQAKALLFPIKWEEPFGLVMIEAMACGTPVIAYNRGSVPEIVKDGVTGFIIDDDKTNLTHSSNLTNWKIQKRGVDGLVEAIRRIGEIDRAACRKHVEEHFSVEKMVEGYEKVYKS